jgi:MoaA/NifB/PqqE/SkfB family radical SAM enzyme
MYKELKFLFNRTPPYFIFWVTQSCNFTCDHCFNYIENQRKPSDLSLEEVRKFASSLGHLKYVTFAGGEPTIRRDLAELAEIFYRSNGLQILNCVTNGWFTDRAVEFARRVLESCPELSLHIAISIDGLEEVHDRIRNKKGSFTQCIKTLRALQRIQESEPGGRLSIGGTGTYNAGNAATFLDVARYITGDVGVPYTMNLIRGEDVQDNRLKAIDIDHYRRVADQLASINQRLFPRTYPLRAAKLALTQTLTDVIYDSFKHDKMTVPCKAGESGFVLTASGEVMLCEILDIRLGNIRQHDYDVMKILNGPRAQEEKRKILEQKCHCTWECFQSMNIALSPSMYPRVAGYMAKNLVRGGSARIADVAPPSPTAATFRHHPLAIAQKQTDVP